MFLNRKFLLMILFSLLLVFSGCAGSDDDDDSSDSPIADDDTTVDDDDDNNDAADDDDDDNDDNDDNDDDEIIYCEGDFDTPAPTGSLEAVPGTVIYWRESPISRYWPAPNRIYTASPSIVILPNGSYLVSFNLFGDSLVPHASESGTTYIYRSADGGQAWENLTPTPMMDMKRGSLFVHNDDVYMWGYRAAPGDIIIRKSTDNGETWTEPIDEFSGLLVDRNYGGTPFNPMFFEGRIWFAVSNRRLMSVDTQSDLLNAANWAGPSNLANTENGPLGPGLGVGESQIVASPDTGVVLMPKVNGLPYTVLVHGTGNDTVADPVDEDWVPLPGGEKKFGAGYDEVSGRFYVLSNPVPAAHPGYYWLSPQLIRNTAAILSSKDLMHWDVEQIFLYGPHVNYEAWQYMNFDIEGDDMLIASRTAFDIGTRFKPPRGHDSNLITFHRIKDFRNVKPCHFLRIEEDGVNRYELSQHGKAPLGSFVLGDLFDGEPLGTVVGIARGNNGNVLVEEEGGRILCFDALGNFIETLSSSSAEFQTAALGVSQPAYGERTWIADGDGNWDDLMNWFYWGLPDTNYEIANFGSAISISTSIFIDRIFTMKGIRFHSPVRYTLAGAGQIIIEADSGNGIIEAKAGRHQINVPVTLKSDTDAGLEADGAVRVLGDIDLNGKLLSITGQGLFEIVGSFAMDDGRIVLDGLSALSFEERADLTLDGELEFLPDSSLDLSEGAVFQLMDVGDGLNDEFENIVLPELPDGLTWDTSTLYSLGTVEIVIEK